MYFEMCCRPAGTEISDIQAKEAKEAAHIYVSANSVLVISWFRILFRFAQ